MRIHSALILTEHPDGWMSPKVTMRIGPMTAGPGSVLMPPNTLNIKGMPSTSLMGRFLEVEIEDGTYIVKGVYDD